MRRLIIIVILVIVLIAAIGVYLWATTPAKSAQIAYPLSPSQRAMVGIVPAAADSFALIPTAAALDVKLHANPMTRSVIDDFRAKQPLPPAWIVGNADLVAWHTGDHASYAIRLDSVRASLVRFYLMFSSDVPGRWSGNTFIINSDDTTAIAPADANPLIDLARGLPPCDALIVQRVEARGAYPPLGRPAVTAVAVEPDAVTITSHAASDPDAPAPAPLSTHFPDGALLAATFVEPPRVVGDLNHLFGAKVSGLLDHGGSVVVYDIDLTKLLPRPVGLIVLPDDPPRRAAFDSFTHTLSLGEALGIHPRTAAQNGELLLSFDDVSFDRYRVDRREAAQWPAARWAARLNPQLAAPKLADLRDNTGLRIAAPHLFHSARDLSRWIEALQQAGSIEAVDVPMAGGIEELRVRVTQAISSK